MASQNPYQIVKHRHITEKAMMHQGLKKAESNPSLKACEAPKYVFIVDTYATKGQIATAIEEIYKAEGVKVVAVNTINVKRKQRRVAESSDILKPLKRPL